MELKSLLPLLFMAFGWAGWQWRAAQSLGTELQPLPTVHLPLWPGSCHLYTCPMHPFPLLSKGTHPVLLGNSASLCYLLAHSEVQHCRPELPTRLKFISLLAIPKISTTAWMGKVRRDNFFPPVLSADFHYCHTPWTCFTLSTDKAK